MTMQETIDHFIDYLMTQKGRSQNTRESDRHDLERCAAFFTASGINTWQDADQYAIPNIIGDVSRVDRPNTTINRTISSLRQHDRFPIQLHEFQVNPRDYNELKDL